MTTVSQRRIPRDTELPVESIFVLMSMSSDGEINDSAKVSLEAIYRLHCLDGNNEKELEKLIRALKYLDELKIYSSKLAKLWRNCCKKDLNAFYSTIEKFKSMEKYIIHRELSKDSPKSFL